MHKRRVEASVEAHALKCLSSRLKWLSTGADVLGSNYGKVMLKNIEAAVHVCLGISTPKRVYILAIVV